MSCSADSRYRSAAVVTRPACWSWPTCFSPTPSMSIAPRETKCLSSCHWRPGQARRLGAIGPLGGMRRGREDLRDDVAGAQHDDLVAHAQVLAREVLLVVQRRQLDGDAADLDGLEDRERVQVAELADVPHDVLERRDLRRRRELPGDRPAGVAPDDAQAPLQLEVADLHHDAVDLEVEVAAALLPGEALLDDLVLRVQQPDVGVD